MNIHDGTYWVGDDVALPANSVIHLRGKGPYWNGHGKGVITEHGAALGLAATVATYASGVFTSGIPAGYLKSNQPNMTADQAQTLKSTWLAQHGGTKRSIAVLNATTEFHPISHQPGGRPAGHRPGSGRCAMSPSPSGSPPTCWGSPATRSTYANVESRMIELRTFTLLPWQRRIESTLDAQLPKGTSLKVRSDGLLRADTSTRYSAYSAALDRRVADRRRGTRARGPPTTAERRGVVMTDQSGDGDPIGGHPESGCWSGWSPPTTRPPTWWPTPAGSASPGAPSPSRSASGPTRSRCTTTTSTQRRMGIGKCFEDGDDGLVGHLRCLRG